MLFFYEISMRGEGGWEDLDESIFRKGENLSYS